MSKFTEIQVGPDLISRAKAGEEKAQEGLYRAFSGPVYTLACRMTGQPTSAEEVLQDTFVAVLDRLGEYRGEAPLGAWIRKIAVNQCLMQLRSPWHRRGRSMEGMAEVVDLVVHNREDWTAADTAAAGMDLEQALGQLDPVSRAVVWLYDVEGYTHPEIAEMMGKTVSFSKSQLARSHRRLQALLVRDSGGGQCMPASNNS